MKARLVKFGEIEVEGERYTHDVVIDGGKVRKRKKGPSKEFREQFGHTPLSAEEEIPWGGKRLLVGTGAHGALPVMDEVLAEAKRRGIEVIAAPTLEVCQLLEEVKKGQAYAILHIARADRRFGRPTWSESVAKFSLSVDVVTKIFLGRENGWSM
jgi:hypothetical protein